jgi:hypothetical protein
MKSRSRTIITRVLVFLLLGAIVNVAVAWGCVFNAREAITQNGRWLGAEALDPTLQRLDSLG